MSDETYIEKNLQISSSLDPENISSEILELSRISWKSDETKQHYTKGAIFSPDGTCILTAINLDGMHIFDLPQDLYTKNEISNERPLNTLKSAVHVDEGGTVYDYCWYPKMQSIIPETCCWIATRQHEPIQLWDAFNGDLRASYRGYDAVDEVEAALSVIFSIDGTNIIGGYKKNIKVFQTSIPGRDYYVIPTKQTSSCIAINPTNTDIIVSGSWNSSITMYDLRIANLGELGNLKAHTGGITQIKFSSNGNKLFSGARKDNKLLEWDMRNFSKPVKSYFRNVDTNQRIYFDINYNNNLLVSGDTKGLVHIWNMNSSEDFYEEHQFQLHQDCCNGVSFHPSMSILASNSGQYHFLNSTDEKIIPYENSIILWWLGKQC